MRHTNSSFTRALVIWTATVFSLALTTGIFAKVFATNPEERIEVDEPKVSIIGGPFAYTGSQICPSDLVVTVWDGEDVLLNKDTDYTFTCGENIEVGELSGVINISNVPTSLYAFDDFEINFPIWEHLQEISYGEDSVELTYGDNENEYKNESLTKTNVQGDIIYQSSDENVAVVDDEGNVEILMPGDTKITAIAEAANGYGEGVASYTLKVNKRAINVISATVENKIYDGTVVADVTDFTLDDEEYDYLDVEATFDNANVGIGKNVNVTLALDNDTARYFTSNTYSTTADIEAFEIDDGILSQDQYIYSGAENKPTVRIPVSLNGEHDVYLTEGTDFEVTYPDDMVNAGEKTILVSGINNFEGDFELYYDVETYTLTANNILLEYSATKWDGNPKTPSVIVKVGDIVVNENDYTIRYDNNIDAGVATVTVTAKENTNIDSYAVKTFEITEKTILDISGVNDQTVVYTGSPVVLAGNLIVGENAGNITADDLTITWYDEEKETSIDQPTEVGSYVVVYGYNDDNYIGSLTVNFAIVKAESPMPAEMTNGLTVEAGYMLDDIEGERTEGFWWEDDNVVVAQGLHSYAATYTYNDDEDNYTTLHLNVPVYGYALVNVYVDVDTDGGVVEYPDEAVEGEAFDIEFLPEAGYELKSVMLNGMEVTSMVKDNKLKVTAGTTDIDVLVSFRRVYNVIEGNNMNYVVGSSKLASFRFDVDHDLFVNGGKVYVDGQLIGEGYYTHTSGSTIITLSADLMNLLGNGEHMIAVMFGDGGIARANFSVAGATESPVKTPNTGFFSGIADGVKVVSLTALVVAGIAGAIVYKKKFAGKRVDFDKK